LLSTTAGDLDLIGHVEPIGGYDDLDKRALTVNISGIDIRVIDLDDLIRIKQHINRPKDQASLLQLLAIRKIRDETGKK
jgi:predicted nucleotidyltransferase